VLSRVVSCTSLHAYLVVVGDASVDLLYIVIWCLSTQVITSHHSTSSLSHYTNTPLCSETGAFVCRAHHSLSPTKCLRCTPLATRRPNETTVIGRAHTLRLLSNRSQRAQNWQEKC